MYKSYSGENEQNPISFHVSSNRFSVTNSH
jgi:hypothetical protein